MAAHARGAVLLARGRLSEARQALRVALLGWQDVSAPYEAARVRLLLAQACAAQGDTDTAQLERDVAIAALQGLGASLPAQPTFRAGGRQAELPGGLTPREAEVLFLVARGRSNADIAEVLVLSVRTVERHLATIYRKLNVQGRNARAAAISIVLRGQEGDSDVRQPT